MNEAAAITLKILLLLVRPLLWQLARIRRRQRLCRLKRLILEELAQGLELARALRSRDPECSRTMILEQLDARIGTVQEALLWRTTRLAEFEQTPRDAFGRLGRGVFRELICESQTELERLLAERQDVEAAEANDLRELYLSALCERLNQDRDDLEAVMRELTELGDQEPAEVY